MPRFVRLYRTRILRYGGLLLVAALTRGAFALAAVNVVVIMTIASMIVDLAARVTRTKTSKGVEQVTLIGSMAILATSSAYFFHAAAQSGDARDLQSAFGFLLLTIEIPLFNLEERRRGAASNDTASRRGPGA